jgi:RES domain-containing protein
VRAGGEVPFRQVSGRFYRAVLADRVDSVLAPPGPDSAGRYHRPGQAAIYLTAESDWAVIAMGGYMAEDGLPRVVVPLDLTKAWVFDQQDAAACAALGIDRDLSNSRWRKALLEGDEPPSWRNSDAARREGADGIIDRSRGIVGGWHVALFRWNTLGGPAVNVAGEPVPACYEEARSRWPSPSGWQMPKAGEAHV